MNSYNKQKLVLLIIGGLLVCLGLIRPNLSNIVPVKTDTVTNILVEAPTNEATKDACNKVISSLSSGPNPKKDGMDLAALYSDIALLISLDAQDEVIKNTAELVQANKISGSLLHLNLKNKYDNLSSNCQEVIVSVIGDENLPLDKELRTKSVTAFRNLAWACKKGAE